jgi:hypothetical protein
MAATSFVIRPQMARFLTASLFQHPGAPKKLAGLKPSSQRFQNLCSALFDYFDRLIKQVGVKQR